LIVTEFTATKSHPQIFSKGPLDLPKLGSYVGIYGPSFQLENKAKLKPINWLIQNIIW